MGSRSILLLLVVALVMPSAAAAAGEPSAPGIPQVSGEVASGRAVASWTAATDAETSVAGYSVTWSSEPTGRNYLPATVTTNTITLRRFLPGTWWLHVAAVDTDGNLGPSSHAGPFDVPNDWDMPAERLPAAPTVTAPGRLSFETRGPRRLPIATVRWTIAPIGLPLTGIGVNTSFGNPDTGGGVEYSISLPATARSTVVPLSAGLTLCLNVETFHGELLSDDQSHCVTAPVDDRGPKSTGFVDAGRPGAYRGTIRVARQADAKLTRLPVIGRKTLIVVADTCPPCGAFRIMRGHSVIAKVSTRRAVPRRAVQFRIFVPLEHRGGPLDLVTTSSAPVVIDAVAGLRARY